MSGNIIKFEKWMEKCVQMFIFSVIEKELIEHNSLTIVLSRIYIKLSVAIHILKMFGLG